MRGLSMRRCPAKRERGSGGPGGLEAAQSWVPAPGAASRGRSPGAWGPRCAGLRNCARPWSELWGRSTCSEVRADPALLPGAGRPGRRRVSGLVSGGAESEG